MNDNNQKDIKNIEHRIESWLIPTGNLFVSLFHRIALFAIGAATVWAAGMSFFEMMQKPYASVQDLLLLFIYLEIGAMVGIYFKTNHMPVRFLIYIGITALTRHLVDLVADGEEHMMEILSLGVTVLILALSIVLIRYASYKFPSSKEDSQ